MHPTTVTERDDLSTNWARVTVPSISLASYAEVNSRRDTGVERRINGLRVGNDHNGMLRALANQLSQQNRAVARRASADVVAHIDQDDRTIRSSNCPRNR